MDYSRHENTERIVSNPGRKTRLYKNICTNIYTRLTSRSERVGRRIVTLDHRREGSTLNLLVSQHRKV